VSAASAVAARRLQFNSKFVIINSSTTKGDKMNITELKRAVDLAIERGIRPDTEVVISVAVDVTGLEWARLADIIDPSDPKHEETYIWFTLTLGEEADSRFTLGHYKDEES